MTARRLEEKEEEEEEEKEEAAAGSEEKDHQQEGEGGGRGKGEAGDGNLCHLWCRPAGSMIGGAVPWDRSCVHSRDR